MYLLITYDISNDKRRNKIDKLLSSYGHRVNYSVFELEVKSHLYKKIKTKLTELIGKYDSIRIYKLDKTALQRAIELGENRSDPFELESSYV
jgi:CRISPR-associated protein Cas2